VYTQGNSIWEKNNKIMLQAGTQNPNFMAYLTSKPAHDNHFFDSFFEIMEGEDWDVTTTSSPPSYILYTHNPINRCKKAGEEECKETYLCLFG
jgi:hypothetical protein